MNKEKLNPTELSTASGSSHEPNGILQLDEALAIIRHREEQLARVENFVSKKYLFKLEEKLKLEAQSLKELAGWYAEKEELSSRYTYVLDPQYFEQKLL